MIKHIWFFISVIIDKITNIKPLVIIEIDWYTNFLPAFILVIVQISCFCLVILILMLIYQSLALSQNCLLIILQIGSTFFILALIAYVVL